MKSAGILGEIIAHKRGEIAAAKTARPPAGIEAELADAPAPRDFTGALRERITRGSPAVIAEIKRASPSKGLIREDFDAARHAADYAGAGAACLSLLTDGKYFRGSLDDLRAARAAASLPLLRKDFMIDPYQIAESRLAGADCVLLIAAVLADAEMAELSARAIELKLAVLVEVHDREELERALLLDCELIGINNRDLRNFHTSLDTTLDLFPHVPPGRLLITESGIGGPDDMRAMMDRGVYGFLIGETFMAAPEPGTELRNMLRGAAGS